MGKKAASFALKHIVVQCYSHLSPLALLHCCTPPCLQHNVAAKACPCPVFHVFNAVLPNTSSCAPFGA